MATGGNTALITSEASEDRAFFTKGRARTRCPHCQCAANCRSSREITITHRELYYECTNLFCGHAWHSSESYDYGLRSSAIPDPAFTLPLRPMSRQQVIDMMRDRDPSQPDMFDAGEQLPAPDTG